MNNNVILFNLHISYSLFSHLSLQFLEMVTSVVGWSQKFKVDHNAIYIAFEKQKLQV